ncbi:MAG: dephospho-CoA kinase [Candidatus Coproplasma sp.]
MKQNKIKIAVTGGIGSGKSTVCKIINSLGYPVYSCDEVYKSVLTDRQTVEELKSEFGTLILNEDGSINRASLSAVVFNNEKKLDRLNTITHPKIFKKLFSISKDESGIVFYEVPLLFEGGYQNLFDGVLVVLRDRGQRIACVMNRDGLKEEEVISRLNRQFNYDINDFAEYYVIHNDGNIDNLTDKIIDFLKSLRKNFSL